MLTAKVFGQLPTAIAVFSLLAGFNLSSVEAFGQSDKPAKPRTTSGSNNLDGGIASCASATPLQIKPILNSEYANFPMNWAEGHVYRFGLLRSAQEYDQVFQPAAVAGDRRAHAPDPKIYEKEMIVTISRIMKAPANLDAALQINSIHLQAGDRDGLYVYFSFQDGPESATHTVKATASVRIPRHDVTKVIFVESSKGTYRHVGPEFEGNRGTGAAGELNVEQGQWLSPAAEVPKPSKP